MASARHKIRGMPPDSSGKRLRRPINIISKNRQSSLSRLTSTARKLRRNSCMDSTYSPLATPYEEMPQQKDAATLGMWTFLATEILFFGAMFLAYIVFRSTYPD